MPPETEPVEVVRAALQRGRTRLWVRDILRAATVGAGVVAAGFLFAPPSIRTTVTVVALAVGTIAGLVWSRRHSRTDGRVAILIERGDPSLKNLIITAEELLRYPDRSADWISRLVLDDAASRLRAVDLRSMVPLA